MKYKKGFTVRGPKRKKTKTEKKAASFQNPKKEYYKFAKPKSWLASLKKKQKKNRLV
tara:strand:- start:162 stop:332 length:171 start_codon:yes stop_codon:yes gene_type:complete